MIKLAADTVTDILTTAATKSAEARQVALEISAVLYISVAVQENNIPPIVGTKIKAT